GLAGQTLAAVPAALASAALHSATREGASPAVLWIAGEVLRSLMRSHLRHGAVLLVMLALLSAGVAVWSDPEQRQAPKRTRAPAEQPVEGVAGQDLPPGAVARLGTR